MVSDKINKNPQLTNEIVIQMRRDFIDSFLFVKDLAKKYNIHEETCRKAIFGKLNYITTTVLLKECQNYRKTRRSHAHSKIKSEDVIKMRQMYISCQYNTTTIAQYYNLDISSVNRIINGEVYKQVSELLEECKNALKENKKNRPNKKWTKEKILQSCKQIINDGKPLRDSTIHQINGPLYSAIRKYIGSFKELYRELGIDYEEYLKYSKFKSLDGEFYDSYQESRIGNILFHLKNKSIIDWYIPHKRICKERKWTCDFYFIYNDEEWWLEFDGLGKIRRGATYNSGNNEKINYYFANDFNLKIIQHESELIELFDIVDENIIQECRFEKITRQPIPPKEPKDKILKELKPSKYNHITNEQIVIDFQSMEPKPGCESYFGIVSLNEIRKRFGTWNKFIELCGSEIYHQQGEKNPRAKLKENNIIMIRKEYLETDITTTDLGLKYGLRHTTINHLLNGKSWSHISDYLEECKNKLKEKMRIKLKAPRGVNHPNSKLNENNVVQIRKDFIDGVSRKNIKTKYNISDGCLNHIIHGRSWTHIKDYIPECLKKLNKIVVGDNCNNYNNKELSD